MKRLRIPLFILFLTLGAPVSAATLDSQFSSLVKKQKLVLSQQAACVVGPDGAIVSRNTSMRIIPASVSKLYAFDWALATLPVDFRYETTFYLSGKTLYINGGGDPHFVIEHLREVLQKIKRERNVTITKITFSPSFYFNWKSTPTDITAALKSSLAAEADLPVAKALAVSYSPTPYAGKGMRYHFRSMPLPSLLKQINDYSTNISTDVLFRRLGGPAAFLAYMQKEYGVGAETIYFETGSGLSGNYTTCDLTIRVLKHLEAQLKEAGLELTDIMSVPTLDPGVLQTRAINATDARALVAKSGTLNNHQSLAGIINTTDDPLYFAVFTTFASQNKAAAAKSMIDAFISAVLREHRTILDPFDYVPDSMRFKQYLIARS